MRGEIMHQYFLKPAEIKSGKYWYLIQVVNEFGQSNNTFQAEIDSIQMNDFS
jgi:hypothetical protein